MRLFNKFIVLAILLGAAAHASAQSATIQATTPNPCTIPPGTTSCQVNISYQTTGVTQPGLFFGATLVAYGTSNTYSPNWINAGGYSFEVRAAYNDPQSQVLASIFVSGVQGYDFRPYFPVADNTYRYQSGNAHHRYVFFWATPDFQNLYDYYFNLSPRQGQLLVWQKMYASNPSVPENLNCTATYGQLFIGFGSDRGVVEVGDWLNTGVYGPNGTCPNDFSILGYRPGTTFAPYGGATGLNWSGPDGLTASHNNVQTGYVFRAFAPSWTYTNAGGFSEYSSPKLIEVLPSWPAAFGRNSVGGWSSSPNKTYYNVIRMVLYHGTNQTSPASCTPDPANPFSNLYYSRPDYATYAMEFYLDQQNGILQETLLYDLSGESGDPCSFPSTTSAGNLSNALSLWRWYVDK